jgi:hypothetical protein
MSEDAKIFYVDIGDMTSSKADQLLRNVMAEFKKERQIPEAVLEPKLENATATEVYDHREDAVRHDRRWAIETVFTNIQELGGINVDIVKEARKLVLFVSKG